MHDCRHLKLYNLSKANITVWAIPLFTETPACYQWDYKCLHSSHFHLCWIKLASLSTTSERGGEHSEIHSRKFSFVLDKGTMTSGMTSLLFHTHIFFMSWKFSLSIIAEMPIVTWSGKYQPGFHFIAPYKLEKQKTTGIVDSKCMKSSCMILLSSYKAFRKAYMDIWARLKAVALKLQWTPWPGGLLQVWWLGCPLTDSVGLGWGPGNTAKIPASAHAADLGTRLWNQWFRK